MIANSTVVTLHLKTKKRVDLESTGITDFNSRGCPNKVGLMHLYVSRDG